MTKVRNQYSAEFKLELIKLIEEQGQKVPDVASQYNVGKSTLEKWLQRYRAEQSGKPLATGRAITPEQQEIQRLKKENAQLRLERDILKKASALLAQDSLGFR
jgi:transposase